MTTHELTILWTPTIAIGVAEALGGLELKPLREANLYCRLLAADRGGTVDGVRREASAVLRDLGRFLSEDRSIEDHFVDAVLEALSRSGWKAA